MKSSSENTHIMTSAVKSISYNIILQVSIRLISFVSNAVILHSISGDMLGVINVRLMLLYSTVHCLSREAFRRSCINQFEKKSVHTTINLLWISTPVCIIIGFVLRLVWLYSLKNPDPIIVPNYDTGVNTIIVSVLVEILSEPLYVLAQSFDFIKLKVCIEGASAVVKSVGMIVILCIWPHLGIHAFCLSQMLSSIVYTASYYIYFMSYLKFTSSSNLPITSIYGIFPKWGTKKLLDSKLCVLTWSMYKQTILKQLLTEGERYIMTFFSVLNFSEQGIYDVVSNLGSMAARFVFLPIEDSCYRIFTQIVERGSNPQSSKFKNSHLSLVVLQCTIKVMMLMGLVIVTFGYSYSKLLLLLYGGSGLSNSIAHSLLRWNCLYIFFLAINGITECFVSAARSAEEIDRHNRMMLLYSFIFVFLSGVLTQFWGSKGFIIANCSNMALRIINSVNFIQHHHYKEGISGLQIWLPHSVVFCALGVCFAVTQLSEVFLCCEQPYYSLAHFTIGAACFAAVTAIVLLTEKTLVKFFRNDMFQIEKEFAKKES